MIRIAGDHGHGGVVDVQLPDVGIHHHAGEAGDPEVIRDRIEAAHSFMWAVAGDLSGFEEASRALYAGKWEIFDRLIAPWPEDVVSTINTLLGNARELTG